MHALNERFDKIVCINLANRQDKKEKMNSKFKELGIDVEWFTPVQYGFIPNIVPLINASNKGKFNANQPFEFGAALSHYTIIKQALIEGVEKLFVFEDDVLFHKDFNDKIEKYLDTAPEDWTMLSLYSFMYEILPENKRMNSRWIRSFRSWSFMSYGMKRSLMETYIKKQDKFFTIADAITYNMQVEGYKTMYSCIPTLCIPSDDTSNIRNWQNYKEKPTVVNFGIDNKNYD